MTDRAIYLLATGTIPVELIGEASSRQIVLDVVNFIGVDEAGGWELGEMRVVVFTSVHAVEAVGRRLADIPDLRIYCIGGATREAVAGTFGDASIAGSAGSAGELADLICRRGERGVLFFCGDRRRDELPEMLTGAGIRVDERVVYRTRLTPRRVERDYAGIAFFSPSAVESFFSVNTIGAAVTLFAIGATTAAAIHDRCSNRVLTVERPDKEVLIKRMMDHFLNQR